MSAMSEYDVIIIGGGPAGVSAALYAARGGLNVAIVNGGASALKKAERIQNYYGTGDVSGDVLYEKGIEQAKSVGAEVIDAQATSAYINSVFEVTTTAGKLFGKKLVIATGAARQTPRIDVSAFEGKGVSYCAVCDAFFCRNKKVAVLGDGEYAKHEYEVLSAVASEVVLLTDGKQTSFDDSGVVVDNRKIIRLVGNERGRLCAIEFEDGERLDVSALFIALGVMSSAAIAKSMGVMTDKSGSITVDAHGMTNVDGVYAAGDCTSGIKQVAKAVADGMNVGYSLIADIKGAR